MKKKLTLLFFSCMLLSLFAGCSAGKKQDSHTITVGATPTPHAEILKAAQEQLKEAGYTLKIVEFTDYVQPNLALSEGALDANYFQHAPYLNDFNQEHGGGLVSAGAVHYELFGIYPGKTALLDALPDGATVTVPNDATNETRALLLMQDEGLIRLKDGIDETVKATVTDIADNPKKLVIKEIESAQLARSLQDVDLSVINGNYALQAGLHANQDALAMEPESAAESYANVVAVQDSRKDDEKTKALMAALTSDKVRDFITETYQGAVEPVFQ